RIAVGRLRTPEGIKASVQLAEMVGACTSTAATNGPMSFPQRHPLCGPGASTDYDYVLGLEAPGAHAAIIGPNLASLLDRDTAHIGFGGIVPGSDHRAGGRANAPKNAAPVTADAEASLPLIIAAVQQQMTPDKRRLIDDRKAKITAANHQ